jgi:hypothetical protein
MSDQIMRLAKEAGFLDGNLELFPETIERFAELVRQDEREACAKLCESIAKPEENIYYTAPLIDIAIAAIRQRGEK